MERKERRSWTPTDDVVLISSWLNTSKDAVVGNKQKFVAFWKRIADYFDASPKLAGCEKRQPMHCKQRKNKPLFIHIVDRLSNDVQYFQEKKDGLGRISLSPLQKCTAAIRVLAYGCVINGSDG
uniref:Myb-like domain-containing protein n=1 Tax=Brassica oleracea var. oleracea TaxID=109376 RepID=A0A0D3DN48_BRAOL